MKIVAIMLDGDPGPHYPASLLMLFLPAIVIFIAWLLLRWRKKSVTIAIVLALIAALIVCAPLVDDLMRESDIYLEWPNLILMVFSAGIPFLAIAFFYFAKKKAPNQAPEPTAPSGRGSS